MSRKQRIIISITGIVLVSLILIGLTYGYYLTKIKGNANSKSISVVTANLLLEYADVNDELITDSAVEPGKSWTKTFVATNKGNKTVTYGVALENVVNQFQRKDDIVYTLDCKQYSKTGFSIDKTNKTVTGTISGTCNGVSEETTFPSIGTILVQNDIADDKAQVYTLTITYKEMNVDQSVDMNKTFSAKANIVDPNNFKPYGTNTLATAIIDSAKTAATSDATRTIYQETPTTIPGQAISTETEKTLSKTEDDYGTSYYYRGGVEDNFVNYAGMCWRIVRIQGDGSIKLILASELSCSDTNVTATSGLATDGISGVEGTILLSDYGYKKIENYIQNDYVNSEANTTYNARTKLNAWLERKITKDSDKVLLKNEDWCIGDRTSAYIYNSSTKTYDLSTQTAEELIKASTKFSYSAYKRINVDKSPLLKCDGSKEKVGEIDTNTIGMLTVDEAQFAGGGSTSNSTYYLYDNASSIGSYYAWYLLSLDNHYNSTPNEKVKAMYIEDVFSPPGNRMVGYIGNETIGSDNGYTALRPVITLITGTQITSGNGTVNNAYVVKS